MEAKPEKKKLNRIKVVLVEENRTGRWLADQLSRDPVTVSKWCTNTTQPDLYTLDKIAAILGKPIRDLISSNEELS